MRKIVPDAAEETGSGNSERIVSLTMVRKERHPARQDLRLTQVRVPVAQLVGVEVEER